MLHALPESELALGFKSITTLYILKQAGNYFELVVVFSENAIICYHLIIAHTLLSLMLAFLVRNPIPNIHTSIVDEKDLDLILPVTFLSSLLYLHQS